MKPYFLILPCLLVLTISTGSLAQTATNKIEHPPNGHNSPYNKSLKDVLADPVYYNGEPVRVSGYLVLDSVSRALYLSKADFQANKAKQSIWVHISPKVFKDVEMYNKHFVTIDGIFDGTDYGKNGLYAGALKVVTRLSMFAMPYAE
jgi:hypothetical protein